MSIATLIKEDVSCYSRTSPKKIENPHDKFFKETFGHIEVTRSFLEHYLPQDVIETLNTDTLRLEKDSFINQELEENFSDLLFSADISGKKVYIYFLFEHKSYPDEAVIFQLLKYMTEIWHTKMKKENMKQVPMVIPIIIYHGAKQWNVEPSLGGMIAGYSDFPPALRRFAPDFSYLFYDITNYTDEEIKGEARVRMLFTMFRDIQGATNIDQILEIIEKGITYLKELENKQKGIEYFETFMRYIFSTAKNLKYEDTNKIAEKVEKLYLEGSGIVMTLADILHEKGKEEGIKEGRKERIKEGIKEGRKEGIKEGKEQAVKELVVNAAKEGADLQFIGKITGLTIKEIEKIIGEK